MVYQQYIARELTPLHGFPIEEQARTAALAKELMHREYHRNLVDEIFGDNDGDDGSGIVETITDIYDLDGAVVIVGKDDLGIISSNRSKLEKIRADLEDRLRYFKLKEVE